MRRKGFTAVLVALTFTIGATSCGSPHGERRTGSAPTPTEEPKRGGTLVVGAQQEPQCADWFAPCGNNTWGSMIMARQTLPRAFDVPGNQYQPSTLLVGEPTLDPGPPQRVTYRINPKALWSDGTPITSADFKYTWEEGKAARAAGLIDVADVDDSDPSVALVTWTDTAANWRDRFSLILPSHVLRGKDRSAAMKDGYSFSGGPWIIDHWTRGQEVKLVRNPRYWGAQANLDAVVFKIIPDAAAYLQAYKTGQVDMILVQGAQPEVTELRNLPNTAFEVQTGLAYDFVMLNTLKAPFDSKAVRQALAYATDRDALVTQVSGQLQPDIRPAQAFFSPANRDWYSEPFARYRRDLAKVGDLMRSDGWGRGADGVWAKGPNRARIELTVATGNRRRELSQEILQSQWKEAGFETVPNNTTAALLGGEWAPKGVFHAALLGNFPTSPDPGLCTVFCSRFIPNEANNFTGNDASRIADPALDQVLDAVNRELDPARRKDLVRRGQELLAEDVPVLPLVAVPDVFAVNTAKLGGPVTAVPAFARLNEWFCRSCP